MAKSGPPRSPDPPDDFSEGQSTSVSAPDMGIFSQTSADADRIDGDRLFGTSSTPITDVYQSSGGISLSSEDLDSPTDPGFDPSHFAEVTTQSALVKPQSLVKRVIKSVVAKLPIALKTVVSGERPLESIPISHAPKSSDAWRALRTAPIFDGVPNEILREALDSGHARVLELERDSLIPLETSVGLISVGQVALGRFAPDVLAEERAASPLRLVGAAIDKKERKRRRELGPMMRVSEKNITTFEEGDVVATSSDEHGHPTLACYCVTPATVIVLDRGRLETWRRQFPFMADRFRRASDTARARIDGTAGAPAMVADFFIRHGLSISATLRVRKLDTCIECKACEVACEDRFGASRLELNGRVLGSLDFVDTCHTCTDQRCVDACDFDAISYNEERKEVLVNESRCVGSGACASACPYDAIKMVTLDEQPRLNMRLANANLLSFGDMPGAQRKARLKRIASKCDHCVDFADQACVAACPTGALIEVAPSDIISHTHSDARLNAQSGYDRSVLFDVNKLNQATPFAKGLKSLRLPELGRARASRTNVRIPLWWTVGLLIFLLSLLEIIVRKTAPEWSISFQLRRHLQGLDVEMALHNIDYMPGCDLAVALGYTGAGLMLSGLLYVTRRRIPALKNFGSLRAWFDWHVMAGTIGPLLILLHSAAKLDNWVSLGVWAMCGSFLSGLLGRYLTTQLPEKASTAELEKARVNTELGRLRERHPGVAVADTWFDDYRRALHAFDDRLAGVAPATGRAESIAELKERRARESSPAVVAERERTYTFGSALRAFAWVMKDDFLRGKHRRTVRRMLKASVAGKGSFMLRRAAAKHALELMVLERRRVLLPRLEPLYSRWKMIHVPFAIALTLLSSIHIYIELHR